MILVAGTWSVSNAAILTNGDAETGDLSGWFVDESGASSGNIGIIAAVTRQRQSTGTVTPFADDYFFSFATKIAGGGSTISMYQTGTTGLDAAALTLSGMFQVEVWRSIPETAEAVLSVFDGSDNLLASATTGSMSPNNNLTWLPFSTTLDLSAVTGAEKWRVELFGTADGGRSVNVFYDSVELTPVPEPSSFATFTGLFSMGLIGYRWRRRRKTA
jgi:hypothetical protein